LPAAKDVAHRNEHVMNDFNKSANVLVLAEGTHSKAACLANINVVLIFSIDDRNVKTLSSLKTDLTALHLRRRQLEDARPIFKPSVIFSAASIRFLPCI
jgi:hypothetical protein